MLYVDDGYEAEAEITDLWQIPPEVVEATSALSVTCSSNYISRHEGGSWSSQALVDWTRLVEGKRLTVQKVLEVARYIVDLAFVETGQSWRLPSVPGPYPYWPSRQS